MSRQRRDAEDARDIMLRLESDGIHDGDNPEPSLLLLPPESVDVPRSTMERIVACVNACRGIATENLAIIDALDGAERAFINERTIPRWDTEARWINRGVADEIVERCAGREAAQPTLQEKLDRILALLEKGAHR